MWEMKLLVLAATLTVATCCDWGRWSPCNRHCGGGNRTRSGDCGVFGWSTETQKKTCNEFCYNRGSFYGGHCHCSSWRSGSCCQDCSYIYMAHCKYVKYACGGSPDNIKCTECETNYVSGGWGNGCRRCDHNYMVERGVSKCKCRTGYKLSYNGYSCLELDECIGTAKCDHICTNTPGSFKCSCRRGYSLDSDGHTCSDVDECLSGAAKCEQICINIPGSYRCACAPGYELSTDGSCKDIDECNKNNGGCAHICVNEQGSFHCGCRNGYTLEANRLSCIDIDECSELTSKCSQVCHNRQGSYTCSCSHGYSLQHDGLTCEDINDCLGITCANGGSCLDNVGSYTCSCLKGFTGKHCEKDIDECTGFLHGGCEDTCKNTVGSFRCECSGNTTLNSDGISCAGGEKTTSVFARHGIVRKLLPRGCSKILLTRCTSGNTVNVFMSSTSPWYQLRSNRSIIYTFGIVFVEVNDLSLPVSITGMEIVKIKDNFAIVSGSLAFNENDGITHGEERKTDCITFTTTPRDIRDFLTSSSFMRSVFTKLENVLPDWLRFTQMGTDILGVNDLQTELKQGTEIQNGECKGAPLIENRLYTVLKFGSSFSVSLYEDKVVLPNTIRNHQFCLIVDICQDYGGSLFLIILEESRNVLNNIGMINKVRQKYGIEFRPFGIGLSLFKHINVRNSATSLHLWNGDGYFTYQIMPDANLWIGGGAVLAPKGQVLSVELKANSDLFVSVPSPQNLLKSVFLEEWDVYLKLELLGSIGLKFKLFGESHTLSLTNIVASEVEAYASIGGQKQRTLCGKNADPPGFFTSLMVDINPFREIPVLKYGLFDISNRVYAYFATNPKVNIDSNIDIIRDIIELKEMTEMFINTTVENVFRYSSLLSNQSVVMLNHLQTSARQLKETLTKFIQELLDTKYDAISHIIENVSSIWKHCWTILKKDVENFLDSIEHNTVISKYNFTDLTSREIGHLRQNFHIVTDKLVTQVMNVFENPSGFGIRYKGSLEIFHLKIAGLEIELVYSLDHLGSCGRFAKVYELLKGERAARIYGVVSTGLLKIAPFLRMDVGFGISIALSIDTPGKVNAEASLFGITGSVDVFFNSEWTLFLYRRFYMENI